MTTNALALYQIADQYLDDLAKLSDLDLPPEAVADTLEGLQGALEVKATNVAMYARNLEAAAEQIKAAEVAMAARRKAIESRADHLRTYLRDNMMRTGISKIECPYFKLSLKKNPAAVVIDDEGKIPRELYIYPEAPPPYPDKKAIKAAIEAGQHLDGAHLEQAMRLEIK